MRIEESAEIDALGRAVAKQELLLGMCQMACALGAMGVGVSVWFVIGFPGPELDHQWVQEQARHHAGMIGAIVATSIAVGGASVIAALKAGHVLERLVRTKAFVEEQIRSRQPSTRRGSQVALGSTARAAAVRSTTRSPSVPDADADQASSQALTNTLLAMAAIETLSQAETTTGEASGFSGDGGSFGGAGATGDFSSNV